MKKYIFAVLFTLCIINTNAQQQSNFEGGYRGDSGGDPLGSTRLFVMSDSTYAFVAFGVIEFGNWTQYRNYMIMEPDTTYNDFFYAYANYDADDAAKDTITFDFGNCSDKTILYRFIDSKNKLQDEVMHPLYNLSPNCIAYSPIAYPKEKYDQLQLMLVDSDVYRNIDGQVQTDKTAIHSTHGLLYTFAIDNAANKIKIYFNEKAARPFLPTIGAFNEDELYINEQPFGTKYKLEERKSSEINEIRQRVKTFFETGSDSEIAPSSDKRTQHSQKQKTEVKYNLQNLFEFNCPFDETPEWNDDKEAAVIE